MIEFLIVLLLITIGVVIYLVIAALPLKNRLANLNAELRAQRIRHDQQLKKWSDYAASLKAQNQQLEKYRGVADAEAKTRQLLEEAYVRANAVKAEAREHAKRLTDEAKALLDSATLQADRIVEQAKKNAQAIGGSAYEALKNAEQYERTAKAIKNIIDGYGDQYLVPGHSLLDDLAEEFGYTQAGQELKKARERTEAMIRTGTAAKCEYVEANRRDTAINFVIDAFNGKVDSSLSRVRHDNAGTLEQETRDAFTLVSHNGRAFREARITDEYLAARLDELKWAAITQQLKLEEREEQRRIKEQAREEEEARREYERAMREAATEQEMLRKAMEKAQQQIERASAEQKAQYEAQIQDLAGRLKEAEERNQRALSMAQQTKKGHVYIISNVGSFGEDVFKIGLTRRLDPLDRVAELGDSSVPFDFDVHAMIMSDDAPALESQLHNHFVLMQMNKANHRKEFFRVDLEHVRQEVEKLGLTAKWTMTSEAREYRETLAIEKKIKEDPAARDAWVKRQLELSPVYDMKAGRTDWGERDFSDARKETSEARR